MTQPRWAPNLRFPGAIVMGSRVMAAAPEYDPERCDCGYRERRAEIDALSYDERLQRDREYIKAGPHDLVMPNWRDARDWHAPTCASLGEYPMEPRGSICPKCGDSPTRTYHAARWHVVPDHHDYWRSDLDVWSCLLQHTWRPVEHLECVSACGWSWIEPTMEAA